MCKQRPWLTAYPHTHTCVHTHVHAPTHTLAHNLCTCDYIHVYTCTGIKVRSHTCTIHLRKGHIHVLYIYAIKPWLIPWNTG